MGEMRKRVDLNVGRPRVKSAEVEAGVSIKGAKKKLWKGIEVSSGKSKKASPVEKEMPLKNKTPLLERSLEVGKKAGTEITAEPRKERSQAQQGWGRKSVSTGVERKGVLIGSHRELPKLVERKSAAIQNKKMKGFKGVGKETGGTIGRGARSFRSKVYSPIKKKLPNRLTKSLSGAALGYTVGGFIGGIVVLSGGPFTLLPIVIAGTSLMVLGFALDVAAEAHNKSLEEKKQRQIPDRTATVMEDVPSKEEVKEHVESLGSSRKEGVMPLLGRSVEWIEGKMPNGLSNAIGYMHLGYTGGSMVGALEPTFKPLYLVVGIGGGFVCGFVVDVISAGVSFLRRAKVVEAPKQKDIEERKVVGLKETWRRKKISALGKRIKGFGAFVGSGVNLVDRKVYRYVKGAIPNKLSMTIAAMGIGVTIGGIVGAAVVVTVAGGPFSIIGLAVGAVVFAAFGFVLDIAAEVKKQEKGSQEAGA